MNGLCSCTKNRESPPKHAISNGFVSGNIHSSMITDKDTSEIMLTLLVLVRPYCCVFANSAGACRDVRGNFSFFEVEVSRTGVVMNHFLDLDTNPMVHYVLSGKMTPTQNQLVRNKAELDISKLMQLLR